MVVPAINETDSLKDNIDLVLSSCNHKDIREFILVVCERTTAECLSVIRSLCAENHDVPFILYYQRSPGLGSAVFEAVQQANGSHVVNIAADLDTDPTVIKDMIRIAKKHPDAIILASRWQKGGGFEGYGGFSKLLNYVFQKLLQILYRTNIKDLTYGYRMGPIDKLLSVTWESTGFPIGTETNLKFLRMGYEIIEIPAVWREREQGDSQNSFLTKLKYIPVVLKIRFAPLDSLKSDGMGKKMSS